MILSRRMFLSGLMAALVMTVAVAPAWADGAEGRPMGVGFQPVQRLLDLSGLAWIDGDVFLAVHDAKFPEEPRRARASLLRLPASLDGVEWKPLRPRFPDRRQAHQLRPAIDTLAMTVTIIWGRPERNIT